MVVVFRTASRERYASSSSLIGRNKASPRWARVLSISSVRCTRQKNSSVKTDPLPSTAGQLQCDDHREYIVIFVISSSFSRAPLAVLYGSPWHTHNRLMALCPVLPGCSTNANETDVVAYFSKNNIPVFVDLLYTSSLSM